MIGKLNALESRAVLDFKEHLIKTSGSRIKLILLFGSKARGDFNSASDIDLFILTDYSNSKLRKKIASSTTAILLKYGILLSPKIIEESHFSFLKKLGTGFAKKIEKEGIKIE